MNTVIHRRKICDSIYHQRWFRIILVIVGIDMVVLGFTFAMGIDLALFLPYLNPVIRVIFGLMYIVSAVFMIHYALSYKKIKKESHFICQHCGHINNE